MLIVSYGNPGVVCLECDCGAKVPISYEDMEKVLLIGRATCSSCGTKHAIDDMFVRHRRLLVCEKVLVCMFSKGSSYWKAIDNCVPGDSRMVLVQRGTTPGILELTLEHESFDPVPVDAIPEHPAVIFQSLTPDTDR